MKKMTRRSLFFMLFFSGLILLIFLILQPIEILKFKGYIDFLFPAGIIALKERNLLFIIQGLMLIVILPVYVLTFVFSWKYSANNPKGKYDPDLIDHRIAEFIWWGVPTLMTLLIGLLTWIKTYELDPFKPIASEKKPLTIEVVALQWRWLFIYPEEGIASVNFLQFPENQPIHFKITADAPMNSFWIPRLGGQIYSMPGMQTELYLIANERGDFRGSSANISGEGFANMHFIARASSPESYIDWIEAAKKSSNALGLNEYEKLAIPNKNYFVETFRLTNPNLFDQILMKYTPH